MGRNGLAAEGGACRLCGRGVPDDEQLNSVAAEGLAAAGGEQRVSRSAAALAQPGPQRPDHLRGERGAAFLAAFAGAPDVRAGAQVHVSAGECGELGDPQPGLDGHRRPGVIAAAVPAGAVRGGQPRLGLPGSQVRHDGLVEAVRRDRRDRVCQVENSSPIVSQLGYGSQFLRSHAGGSVRDGFTRRLAWDGEWNAYSGWSGVKSFAASISTCRRCMT